MPGIVGNGILFELLGSTDFVVAAVVRRNKEEQDRQDVSSVKRILVDDMVAKGIPIDKIMDRLIVVCGIRDDGDMSDLCDMLCKEGIHTVNHVISCFGGTVEKGSISSLSEQGVRNSINRSMPHFRLLKTIQKLVKDEACSSYLFITGMLGERCHMPTLACLSLSNAFLYGLILSFQAESSQSNKKFRINEIRIGSMLRRRDDISHPFMEPSTSAYPSDLVGREAIKIVTSKKDRQILRLVDEDFDALFKVESNRS